MDADNRNQLDGCLKLFIAMFLIIGAIGGIVYLIRLM